ncbi:hypothetical protein [Pseudomonas putida]|uniref:hypothetical protein n=1 Tax=Pseudomonas putida TaxID=303 RepID=UPI002B240E64|nr:hypothetical protein [Pseudomonas putida]
MNTNKMRDISREQFEAVFSEKYPLTFAAAKAGESEAHGAVSIAWWGWQSSREAVVVEIEQIRSEAKRQEDGLKEMLRRQNKQICALRGKP